MPGLRSTQVTQLSFILPYVSSAGSWRDIPLAKKSCFLVRIVFLASFPMTMKSAQHATCSSHGMNIQGPLDSHPPEAVSAPFLPLLLLTFDNTQKILGNMSNVFPSLKLTPQFSIPLKNYHDSPCPKDRLFHYQRLKGDKNEVGSCAPWKAK